MEVYLIAKFSNEKLKSISEDIGKLIINRQLSVLISNAIDEGNTEIIPIFKHTSTQINKSITQIDLSDQCMGTQI